MPTKSITQFIHQYRSVLVRYIRRQVQGVRIDNAEIELWIANDESLYLWAQREGVSI